MRHFAFLVLFSLVSCLACAPMTAPAAAIPVLVSANPIDATVALVTDEDRAYCAGTWVGAEKILTASHCVIDDDTDEAAKVVHVRTYTGVIFEAPVLKVDRRVDLALLGAPRPHAYVSLATETYLGEPLTIVGHPNSEEWYVMHGWIGHFTAHGSPESTGTMNMIQVQAPIWYGNSGGGAFDASGRLVGVASMRSVQIPDLGLFVATDEITAFLASS